MTTVTDANGKTYRLPAPVTIESYVYPPILGADFTPVEQLDERYPGVGYTRVYGPHGFPTAAALNAVPASVKLIGVSFKGVPDPAVITKSLTGARRDGRLILVEGFHEPNRSRANGGPLAADYHRDMDVIAATVRKLDPTGEQLGVTQTLMGYAARHLAGDRDWKLFVRHDVDYIGVDLEWDDRLGTTAYPSPEALQAIAWEIADYAGVPLTIPELAWRQLASDPDGIGLGQFYVRQLAYAAQRGAFAVAVYDTDGSTGKYRLLDGSPALAAVKKIIG